MSVEIINLLIEYENSLSKLYNACAKKHPKIESFWNDLSLEEQKHATIIEDVLKQVDNKTIFLKDNRFSKRPVEISIEYVEEIYQRVINDKIDLLGVLSLTFEIEKSVIESKYYEIFAGKSIDFNKKMKKVREESTIHMNKIGDMKREIYSNN